MPTTTDTKALIITRVFDAPRANVWKAWTDPEHLKKWWGPKDYTSSVATIDLKVGGNYLLNMRSPEGKDYYTTGVIRELVPEKQMTFTDNFADEKGNIVPASHYGMAGDWSEEIIITVTLEDQGEKTKMTISQTGIPPGEMTDLTKAGWNESFDKLAVSLQ